MVSFFSKYNELIEGTSTLLLKGQVIKINGSLIESTGPIVSIGDICYIINTQKKKIIAEVIGFSNEKVQLVSLTKTSDISVGCEVCTYNESLKIPVGDFLKGKVLNFIGEILNYNYPPENFSCSVNEVIKVIHPQDEEEDFNERLLIDKQIVTGIKTIDGLLPIGKGQRLGIFSGSGVGKTTLVSMLARFTEADLKIICLVGERKREVLEFFEKNFSVAERKQIILIVSTSEDSPLAKIKCVCTATTIARYFADQGKDILFIVDSITRLALAQREIGTLLGEPPTTRGYTPSVFQLLSGLLEKTGKWKKGSITALYTVLVEGDDLDEPITDAVRGILDGHIILDRELSNKGHYPPIDVVSSISRLSEVVASAEHKKLILVIRQLLGEYNKMSDLIHIGAYVKESNALVDRAIEKMDDINEFLLQRNESFVSLEDTLKMLSEIVIS